MRHGVCESHLACVTLLARQIRWKFDSLVISDFLLLCCIFFRSEMFASNMKNNAGGNVMDGNNLIRTAEKVGAAAQRGASNNQILDFYNNIPFGNAPSMGHSTGGLFEMVKETQQNGRQLDTTRDDLSKLDHENNQLKARVKQLKVDKDAIHSALDDIHDKLEDTIVKLENAQQELVIKSKDLAYQEQQVAALKRQVAQLQTKNEDESTLRETTWKAHVQEMRQQFDTELQSHQEAAQKSLADQQTQHQKAESKLINEIKSLKETFENDRGSDLEHSQKLILEQKSQHEELLGQLQTLQVQLQSTRLEAETAIAKAMQAQTSVLSPCLHIQAPTSPSAAQAGKFDDTKKLMAEMEASHAAGLAESRRLTEFFKNNSERVSREARQLRAENKMLIELVEAKDREIEDQLSHIYAVEAQMEGLQNNVIPEGWAED